jgi:hypothetical protein
MISHLRAKFRGKGKAEKEGSNGSDRTGAEDIDHNQTPTFAKTAAVDRGDKDAQLSARASAQTDRSGRSSTKGRVDGTAPSKTDTSGLGQAEGTVQISGGEQNESAETNEESRAGPIPQVDVHKVTEGPSPQNQESAASPTFTHNTLWDDAYNSLKEDKEKAKFVEAYEKILSRLFLKETTLETSSSDQNGENAIAQDPPSREKQMKHIVEKGLEKIEKAKNATEVYEKIFEFVTPFKAVLDAGLRNVPQAALPWAVVSSSLDVSHLKTSISVKSFLLITVGICRFLPSRQKQARSFTLE